MSQNPEQSNNSTNTNVLENNSNSSSFSRARFRPTNRHNPCPVCSKTNGNCRTNDSLVLCMTYAEGGDVPDFRFIGTTSDSLWGKFVEYDASYDEERRRAWEEERERRHREIEEQRRNSLPIEDRDRHYRHAASRLALRDNHKADLERRGLNDESIQANLFFSLSKGFNRLSGIPVNLPGAAKYGNGISVADDGYFIPAYSLEGLVIGGQIRTQSKENKYRYLRNPDLQNGEKPLSHVGAIATATEIGLCEGYLKPIVANHKHELALLGIPGGNFHLAKNQLEEVLAANPNLERLIIHPDAGDLSNFQVVNRWVRQYRFLKELAPNLDILIAHWGQVEKKDFGDIDEIDSETLQNAFYLDLNEWLALTPQAEADKRFKGQNFGNPDNKRFEFYLEEQSDIPKLYVTSDFNTFERLKQQNISCLYSSKFDVRPAKKELMNLPLLPVGSKRKIYFIINSEQAKNPRTLRMLGYQHRLLKGYMREERLLDFNDSELFSAETMDRDYATYSNIYYIKADTEGNRSNIQQRLPLTWLSSYGGYEFTADRINSESFYLPDLNKDEIKGKVVVPRMPKGAGKSTQARKQINENKSHSVAVTPTVKLNQNFAAQVTDMESLNDLKILRADLMKTDKKELKIESFLQSGSVALCINSMGLLNLREYHEDSVVVFDEIVTMLESMTAQRSHIEKSQIPEIWSEFRRAVKQTTEAGGTVHFLDADIQDYHIEILRDFCELDDEDILRIESVVKPKPFNLYTLAKVDDAYATIVNQLAADKKVLIPLDSAEYGEALERKLNELFPAKKGQLLIAETGHSPENEKFLRRPNEYLTEENLDWFIYNSATSTGVSIDVPHFDCIVALLFGVLSPDEARQMLSRERNKIDVYAWIADKSQFIPAVYTQDVEAQAEAMEWQTIDSALAPLSFSDLASKAKAIEAIQANIAKPLAKLSAINLIKKYNQAFDYKSAVIGGLIELENANFVDELGGVEPHLIGHESMDEIKDNLRDEKAERIANAEPFDLDDINPKSENGEREFRRLIAQPFKTPEDIAKITKTLTCDRFPGLEIDKAFCYEYLVTSAGKDLLSKIYRLFNIKHLDVAKARAKLHNSHVVNKAFRSSEIFINQVVSGYKKAQTLKNLGFSEILEPLLKSFFVQYGELLQNLDKAIADELKDFERQSKRARYGKRAKTKISWEEYFKYIERNRIVWALYNECFDFCESQLNEDNSDDCVIDLQDEKVIAFAKKFSKNKGYYERRLGFKFKYAPCPWNIFLKIFEMLGLTAKTAERDEKKQPTKMRVEAPLYCLEIIESIRTKYMESVASELEETPYEPPDFPNRETEVEKAPEPPPPQACTCSRGGENIYIQTSQKKSVQHTTRPAHTTPTGNHQDQQMREANQADETTNLVGANSVGDVKKPHASKEALDKIEETIDSIKYLFANEPNLTEQEIESFKYVLPMLEVSRKSLRVPPKAGCTDLFLEPGDWIKFKSESSAKTDNNNPWLICARVRDDLIDYVSASTGDFGRKPISKFVVYKNNQEFSINPAS